MNELSSGRLFLWPVKREELKGFLAMVLVLACGLHSTYVMMGIANLERTIQLSKGLISLEPAVFPAAGAAILLSMLYGILSNYLTQSRLFLGYVVAFLGAFSLYIFGEWISLHTFAFLAETWSYLVPVVLVWQVINMMTTSEQAERYYVLLAILGGVVLGAAFLPADYGVINHPKLFRYGWYGLGLIAAMGGIFAWAARGVDAAKNAPCAGACSSVFRSSYVLNMALLVIAQGVAFGLFYGAWQGMTGMETGGFFTNTMGEIFLYTLPSSLLLLFVLKNAVSWWGWKKASLLPILLMVMALGILAFIFYKKIPQAYTLLMVSHVLALSTAGVLFGPLKEMLYLPLSQNERVKGKILVDGVMGVGTLWLLPQFMAQFIGENAWLSVPSLLLAALFFVIFWALMIYRMSALYEGIMCRK